MRKNSNFCNLLWKSNNLQLHTKNIYKYLPHKVNLLLLSDGSFTKVLDSMLGELVQLKLINNHRVKYHMNSQRNLYTTTKFEIHRKCWLIDKTCHKLLFASSWYIPKSLFNHQSTQTIPLGKMFINSELILYRDLYYISCIYSKQLQNQLGTKENIWTREYVLYNQQQPFILIKEFFPSNLVRYLIN